MPKFNLYRVFHLSHTTYLAEIDCYDDEKYVARMRFVENDKGLPPNETKNNIMYIHFHISALSDIMNTLRYEKPLLIHQSGAVGYIGNGNYEEVGEEES